MGDVGIECFSRTAFPAEPVSSAGLGGALSMGRKQQFVMEVRDTRASVDPERAVGEVDIERVSRTAVPAVPVSLAGTGGTPMRRKNQRLSNGVGAVVGAVVGGSTPRRMARSRW